MTSLDTSLRERPAPRLPQGRRVRTPAHALPVPGMFRSPALFPFAGPFRYPGLHLGLVAQVGLLAALTVTTGLHGAGWLTGAVVGLGTWVLLGSGLHGSGARSLGAANGVTLGRTVLVGGIAALAAESFTRPAAVPVITGLTVVALLLDGVDGQVARRTGTASALGARFDMEVDAFLILVLSVLLVGPVAPWVPAIGGMRYAFVLAGWVWPWLTAPLPPRFSRKVVAATQGAVLVAAVSGLLPGAVEAPLLATALALLTWSFGRDVGWLVGRVRTTPRGRYAAAPSAAAPSALPMAVPSRAR